MTHLHFDHAVGLTKWRRGRTCFHFPECYIYVSEVEWNEMRNPNIRSRNTYWKENWEPIQSQVNNILRIRIEVVPGIEMIHTGGHSDGHSIIKLKQHGETIHSYGRYYAYTCS